jgi:thiol-disulfide isomerase/thioredoxin
MKKNCIYFFFLLFISFGGPAQTIYLEFPYFAGQTYEFTIFQGDTRIKLKEETIAKGGKVQLTIPDKHKSYKGMAQWYLTNSPTGGGLDLIINNEDFSVTCLDSLPTAESIVYMNTQENIFDKSNYQKQQKLFEKHDAMLATKRAYEPKSEIYKLAEEEYTSIIKQYDTYSNDLKKSSLFAAKFRQIVNLTMGIGTIITLDENEKANNINEFIVNELDFSVLYTSNHWGGIINSWTEIQIKVFKDDTKMFADAITILNRIKSDNIYTDFVINLTKELTRAGKDDVLYALIPTIKNSKRLLNYDGVLNLFQQDLSGKAPDLTIVTYNSTKEAKNQITTVIKTADLKSKFTLLVFYNSGCGPCEATMLGLVDNYKEMVSRGIKIISIAADTDEKVFKDTSVLHPWSDKYCDFQGANGINFKNYAVIGTPTMYLLDSKGIILSKMATISHILEFLKKSDTK